MENIQTTIQPEYTRQFMFKVYFKPTGSDESSYVEAPEVFHIGSQPIVSRDVEREYRVSMKAYYPIIDTEFKKMILKEPKLDIKIVDLDPHGIEVMKREYGDCYVDEVIHLGYSNGTYEKCEVEINLIF